VRSEKLNEIIFICLIEVVSEKFNEIVFICLVVFGLTGWPSGGTHV